MELAYCLGIYLLPTIRSTAAGVLKELEIAVGFGVKNWIRKPFLFFGWRRRGREIKMPG